MDNDNSEPADADEDGVLPPAEIALRRERLESIDDALSYEELLAALDDELGR